MKYDWNEFWEDWHEHIITTLVLIALICFVGICIYFPVLLWWSGGLFLIIMVYTGIYVVLWDP